MADADRLAAALRFQEDQDAMRPVTMNPMLARQGDRIRSRPAPPADQSPAWHERALPMEGRATFLPFRDTLPGSVMNKREVALPGLFAGALNAISAPGRAFSGSDPMFYPEQEALDVAMNLMGGGAGVGRAPAGSLGMNVWHASPHRFPPTAKNPLGEFDATKIGTGEGAQAYGYGHYSAEAKGIGEDYLKTFSQRPDAATTYLYQGSELQPLSKSWKTQSPDEFAVWALKDVPSGLGNDQKAQIAIKEARKKFPDAPIAFEDAIDEAARKSFANAIETKKGSLYKVDLPDEQIAKMLDWDRPFSQQAPEVRKILQDADIVGKDDWLISGMKGREIYNRASFGAPVKLPLRQQDDQIYAAQRLREAGIPGIRYLDQGSRGAGQGTSNFVVFPGNEALLKILERQ